MRWLQFGMILFVGAMAGCWHYGGSDDFYDRHPEYDHSPGYFDKTPDYDDTPSNDRYSGSKDQ